MRPVLTPAHICCRMWLSPLLVYGRKQNHVPRDARGSVSLFQQKLCLPDVGRCAGICPARCANEPVPRGVIRAV